MIFSIIIPSFNQEKYIRGTLENVTALKRKAADKGIQIEILLMDNESNESVQQIISEFASQFDRVVTKKDKGQFDAINNGTELIKGDYWTWLNTDDLIDMEGFFKISELLNKKPEVDYIYGGVKYIDSKDHYLSIHSATPLTLNSLVNKTPGIFQPGSFFKVSFTKKIGTLKAYQCCFDYEYILRCLKNNAVFYCCDFPVASFRYHTDSKTGRMIPVFIREQLQISKMYGRRTFSFLTWFSYLRLLKHRLVPVV